MNINKGTLEKNGFIEARSMHANWMKMSTTCGQHLRSPTWKPPSRTAMIQDSSHMATERGSSWINTFDDCIILQWFSNFWHTQGQAMA